MSAIPLTLQEKKLCLIVLEDRQMLQALLETRQAVVEEITRQEASNSVPVVTLVEHQTDVEFEL